MPTKVLVFESDAGFAGELRNELGKLGCNTHVVDDGNVGLQQAASDRPDLILLSIELPRMNGFSVCNKLKKDPALKDVPLIIMSSESSDETFEQHRKLRTRAEDYVHKPIAFGELLGHIQAFVPLTANQSGASHVPGPPSEAAIVIDDEVALVTDFNEDDSGATQIARRPDFPMPKPKHAPIDKDVDDFAESAFDRLTGGSVPPPPLPAEALVQNGTGPQQQVAVAAPPPVPHRPASQLPPRPSGVDPAEHDRVRADLDKAKVRAVELERELGGAKADIARLQSDAQRASRSDADSQRMQREIDELKAKIATAAAATSSGAKTGISSRDFLDLREALNKKDKEILSLKEALSKKDKEIVESTDKGLTLERSKADLEDKVLATERELADARDKIDALTADKDLAKKASEDWKTRFERAKGDIETKVKEAEALRAKHAEETTTAESKAAATKAELEQTIAKERDAHASALEQAEAKKRSEIDDLTRAHEALLSKTKDEAAKDKADSLATRESRLKADAETKLSQVNAAHKEELEKALAAAEDKRKTDLAARENELEEHERQAVQAAERDRDHRLAVQAGEHAAVRSAQDREHAEKVASVENDRDARIAALESKLSRELGDVRAAAEAEKDAAEQRISGLEANLASAKSEIADLTAAKRDVEAKLADTETRLDAMSKARADLEVGLGSAKDRITALESDLGATQRDLEGTKGRLAKETGRADKAFAKWEADKGSLDRVKDALALALSQVEEAESRAIAD